MRYQRNTKPGFGHNSGDCDSAEIIDLNRREWIKPDITELPDSLADLSTNQIWQDCVWLSDERTAVKIFLLCVGRFFKEDGTASSMSYAQIARECGLAESTVKLVARDIRGTKEDKRCWLTVDTGKG